MEGLKVPLYRGGGVLTFLASIAAWQSLPKGSGLELPNSWTELKGWAARVC